ncbi:FAD-dependent monooxygenase [Plantactinospora siamensis]|uniref:FAD-dependent monooxygenase n=1 Tax=Plantactinospora siamensis TaxID=555372 RepID=A0ABV6NWM6_9ACTN
MTENRIPVLIVGGGLCGLSAAALLAWHGVPVLLVERHDGALRHPRARVINPRTAEIFRQIGLEEQILAARSFAHREPAVFLRARTLAGPETGRGTLSNPTGPDGTAAFSPCPWAPIDQDRLEELVAEHAQRLGAQLRYGTELVGCTQEGGATDGSVRVLLRERAAGREYEVDCAYLIAADGHASEMRTRLGIELAGYGSLGNLLSLVFAADLTPAIAGRQLDICHLDEPEVGTVLLPHDRTDRWVFSTPYHPERGETVESISEQRCVEAIRRAVGLPDLAVQLLPQLDDGTCKLAYAIAAGVGQRYRSGRIFLVGDAAHLMPPAGAFGAGTGIQDAHNLAWKLALVLTGRAPAALLDSYQAERRPAALFTVEQALRQLRARSGRALPGVPDVPPADYFSVVFGLRYHSALLSLDGGDGGAADGSTPAGPDGGAGTGPDGGWSVDGGPALGRSDDDPLVTAVVPGRLRGQPGTRAPHVPLGDGAGDVVSTVDLFGRDFVLMSGPRGDGWADAAARVAVDHPVPLRVYRIDTDLSDPEGRFATAHGVSDAGAVLVRPDGIVTWRSVAGPADPDDLRAALDRATGRTGAGPDAEIRAHQQRIRV